MIQQLVTWNTSGFKISNGPRMLPPWVIVNKLIWSVNAVGIWLLQYVVGMWSVMVSLWCFVWLTSPRPFLISSMTSTMSLLLFAYSPRIHKAWRWILWGEWQPRISTQVHTDSRLTQDWLNTDSSAELENITNKCTLFVRHKGCSDTVTFKSLVKSN